MAWPRTQKNIRINLFVVVGVIRLIIVAVIIANTIIIIIIRIRHPLPWLKYSTVHPRCLTLGLCQNGCMATASSMMMVMVVMTGMMLSMMANVLM